MRLRTAAAAAGAAAGGIYAAHAAPVLTSARLARTTFLPDLAGLGRRDHVALTYDDGPDPVSTPKLLDLLAEHDVTATFFLLGFMLQRNPSLGREIVAAGHEVAVHGYQHRSMLRRTPWGAREDITRAHDLIAETTGVKPRFYRPPFGVLTTAAWRAAASLDMTTTLWTAWGKDWSEKATPASVRRTVLRGLDGGGTILLHDADCTSAWESWRSTLGATPLLIEDCRARGLSVGSLGEHRTAQVADLQAEPQPG